MVTTGLRERKKAKTRQIIAESAARLFAEHGYEQVAVADVAREAEVAEQTVYNYFRSKEQLVTDRDEQVRDNLCTLIRTRPPETTSVAAVRGYLLDEVAGIRDIPPDVWPGEIGHLAVISPAVHRLMLELTDRQAVALAEAIRHTDGCRWEIALMQGRAIAGVFQIIIEETGRRTSEGQSPPQVARALRPMTARVIDELERWFAASPTADAAAKSKARRARPAA